MRSYARTSTMQELKASYLHANKTCNLEVKKAMNKALDETVDAAKVIAPVYDPERWPAWSEYEHHYTPPGTLKESITHTKAVAHGRGASYSAQFRANAPFASYQEKGFRHRKAHRKIPGKYFMTVSSELVFPQWFDICLDLSVQKMLLMKST